MSKPKVVVTRALPSEALKPLRQIAEVRVWEGKGAIPGTIWYEWIANAEAILSTVAERIDDAVFDHARRLKVVANYGVGYDHINLEAATRRGVMVTNTPDVVTEATADFTFALLLAVARRVVEADSFTRSGSWREWDPALLVGQDIFGATLGLIGLGRIGKAVARRAMGFGMRVLYHDPRRDPKAEEELGVVFTSFDYLVANSDFVSVHVPLMESTRNLINESAFSMMKPTAIFINAARGGVVDYDALVEALEKKQILGAGLDVFPREPINGLDPILRFPNVVVAPHIGTATNGTRLQMAQMAVRNIIAVLNAETPPNLVNGDVILTKSRMGGELS